MKSSRRLRFSADARKDLRDIRRHAIQRWGEQRHNVYESDLRRAMDSLLEFPELGPTRNDLFAGCRNLSVNQHVIFYRIDGDVIVVGRVLHPSQDPVGKVVL